MTTKIKQLIKIGPFIALAADGLAFFFTFFDWYKYFQWFHSQLVGHSLLGLSVWLFYARLHRYCMYSIVSLYTFMALNILNIVYFFVDLVYHQLYAGIIIFGGLTLASIYFIKTWRNQAQS